MPMSEPNSDQNRFVAELLEEAAAGYIRGVLVISGCEDWCCQRASELLQSQDFGSIWWLGGNVPQGVESLSWERARTRLGREVSCLVIDAHAGFDADGFGALSGTVLAGGLLLLLTPPLDEWHSHADPESLRFVCYPNGLQEVSGHFLERFARTIRQISGIALWCEDQSLPPLPEQPRQPRKWHDPIYASAEQREAVEAIHHVLRGHPQRPLVLSADRGRGKSAALGIAAAQLLHEGLERIVVTAPRIVATDALFNHAVALLPGCEVQRGRLLWQGRRIEFVAPDALLLAPHQAQLLLVDEAAAIPASMLERFLGHFSRIVFSTTVHGYEGTGRGFALRFQQTLNERTPYWQAMKLSAPVRWADGDPLERLSFAALLLDAEPISADRVKDATVGNCRFERLEPERLAENESELRELFGLLVLAHYRTSPNDLRQLLDSPGQSLYVLRYEGHIVAIALLAHEGGLEPELARQVMMGRRRVRGHLLPQSLANHAGLIDAAQLHIARTMRIAVHPALHRRGLGSHLLQQLRREAETEGCDLLGTSFGADVPLLRFWLNNCMQPVRIGLSREASSGSHAVMMLAPLSSDGERLFELARERFVGSLPELLAEPLAGLENELVNVLLTVAPPGENLVLNQYDWSDIESFAFGLRGYENCLVAIRKLVLRALGDGAAQMLLDTAQQSLLEEKVVKKCPWPQLCRHQGLPGRKAALQALREVIALLYSHYRVE